VCPVAQSPCVYLLYRVSQKWRLAFLHPAHSAPACNMPPNHRRRCHVSALKAADIAAAHQCRLGESFTLVKVAFARAKNCRIAAAFQFTHVCVYRHTHKSCIHVHIYVHLRMCHVYFLFLLQRHQPAPAERHKASTRTRTATGQAAVHVSRSMPGRQVVESPGVKVQ
jgi:hypothetical protein